MRFTDSPDLEERSTGNSASQEFDLVKRVALLVENKDREGLHDEFERRRDVMLREGMDQMGALGAASAYMRTAAEQAHKRYAGDANRPSAYLELTHEVVNSHPLY